MAANAKPLGCLNGVRVLDLSQFEAGPTCTEALAWLGAEVVKVENPKLGDPGRAAVFGSPEKDPYYFLIFNANKKSITMDLKSPEGMKLVRELAAKADVMVENFAPGAIERLGFGYDEISKINPGIIYAQVKGFGEGSPYEKNLAFDMIAQACGGTISITGERDGTPVKPGLSLGDTGTGMLMAISVLGALCERRRPARATACRSRCRTRCCTTSASTSRRRRAPASRSSAPARRRISGGNPPSASIPCKRGGPNDYV